MKKIILLVFLFLALFINYNPTFVKTDRIMNYSSKLSNNIDTNIKFKSNLKKYEKYNDLSINIITKNDKDNILINYLVKDKNSNSNGIIAIKNNKLYLESKDIEKKPILLCDKIDINKVINNSKIINNLNIKLLYTMKKYNYSIDKNNINKVKNSFISLIGDDRDLIIEFEKILNVKSDSIDRYLKRINSFSLKKVIKDKKIVLEKGKDFNYIIKVTNSKNKYFNIYINNKDNSKKLNDINVKKAIVYKKLKSDEKSNIILNYYKTLFRFIKL